MTEAEREVYDAILQTIYEQMIVQINNGRGSRINGKLEDVIDNGPYYLAQDAMAAGLVDSLIYQDQLEDKLKDRYGFTARKGSLTSFAKYDWNIPVPNR
jgi:protease-4